MRTHKDIISLWPTAKVLTSDLNSELPDSRKLQPCTIHKWKVREFIPGPYWSHFVSLGEKRKIKITHKELCDFAKPKP